MYAIVTVAGLFASGFMHRDSAEEAMALWQAARPDVYFWVEEVVNNETELP